MSFIDFLSKYWRLIFEGILLLVSVFIFIKRKKPVTDVFADIYFWCICAINGAEQSTHLKGSEKLKFVLDFVSKKLLENFPDIDVKKYETYIVSIVESILSTPQKKEV